MRHLFLGRTSSAKISDILAGMRWHTISVIAAAATIAVSVLLVFRPYYTGNLTKPPSAGLIDDQCAATPDDALMAPEYTCNKR